MGGRPFDVRGRAKPFPIGEWTIPEGELAFVNVAGLHRDETLYPEPERFRPERFIERRFSPWEFVPFGGGTRRCLGAAFAEAELGVGIAVFAREWDLELTSRDQETRIRRNITMGPKNGIEVRAKGRRN